MTETLACLAVVLLAMVLCWLIDGLLGPPDEGGGNGDIAC